MLRPHALRKTTVMLLTLCYLTFTQARLGNCPFLCSCSLDTRGRREVLCDSGGLNDPLPVTDMPSDTEVLIVDAPEGMHNTLTLGPIFQELRRLEILTVSKSKVPAIGEHSFWGLRSLHTLNISRNLITSLMEANFRGPDDLQVLDLSRNLIESMPSAVFRHAKHLKSLSLAHNKLHELVPRVFYNLNSLTTLDISYNPLGTLTSTTFNDVPNLREIKCIACGLVSLPDNALENLLQLKHLDFSNNRLTQMPPVSKCHNLATLVLTGNLLTHISENSISDLPLYGLSVGFNRIKHIHPNAFVNSSSLTHLDISYNRLGLMDFETALELKSNIVDASNFVDEDASGEFAAETTLPAHTGTLSPLIHVAANLRRLVLSGNFVQLSDIQPIMRLVRQVRHLGLGELGLSQIPADFLRHARHLRILNVSGNSLSDFDNHLLYSTPHLHSLYLDHNNLRGLSEDLINAFVAMRPLETIRLEGNPWQCDYCHVSSMISWLQSASHQPHSSSTCRTPQGSHLCLRCMGPAPMAGLELVLLREEELPQCGVTEQSSWPAWLGTGSHSQHPRVMGVGTESGRSQLNLGSPNTLAAFFKDHLALLVGVGCGLVMALLVVVVVAVIIVRRQSALYYTSEEEIERQEKLVSRNNNDSPVSRTTQTTPSPSPLSITPYQPMAISRVHARTPITTSSFRSSSRRNGAPGSSSISTIDESTALAAPSVRT